MPCAYLRGALDWGSSACKLWGGRAVAPLLRTFLLPVTLPLCLMLAVKGFNHLFSNESY